MPGTIGARATGKRQRATAAGVAVVIGHRGVVCSSLAEGQSHPSAMSVMMWISCHMCMSLGRWRPLEKEKFEGQLVCWETPAVSRSIAQLDILDVFIPTSQVLVGINILLRTRAGPWKTRCE